MAAIIEGDVYAIWAERCREHLYALAVGQLIETADGKGPPQENGL